MTFKDLKKRVTLAATAATAVEAAIEKGRKYNPDTIIPMSSKSMGIDPAFGSSAFGIEITQRVDNQIQIMYAEDYQKPDFNEMLDVWGLLKRFVKIYINGSNPSFIRGFVHTDG